MNRMFHGSPKRLESLKKGTCVTTSEEMARRYALSQISSSKGQDKSENEKAGWIHEVEVSHEDLEYDKSTSDYILKSDIVVKNIKPAPPFASDAHKKTISDLKGEIRKSQL
jgi:hypothetical protein